MPDSSPNIVSATSERFGELKVFRPLEQAELSLLYFSQGNEISPAERGKLDALSRHGVVVIRVDTVSYLRSLRSQDEDCVYLAGEMERLVQSAEKAAGVRHFIPAAVTGEGMGAPLSKVVFFQHPSSFTGLLELGQAGSPGDLSLELETCPYEDSEEELRKEGGETIRATPPFREEATAALKEELLAVNAASARATSEFIPVTLRDLPLEIVKSESKGEDGNRDTFALFYSGDGGWAEIDRELSRKLNELDIPVVGVSSLQYFWQKQPPETGAQDLERLITAYSKLFNRPRCILVGFSFGADILPAFASRLSPTAKEKVRGLLLLSPSIETDFEIHIEGWLGFDEIANGEAIFPDIEKLKKPVLCLYGAEEEAETVCARPEAQKLDGFKAVELPGDHHFDGDYEKVSEAFRPFVQ